MRKIQSFILLSGSNHIGWISASCMETVSLDTVMQKLSAPDSALDGTTF